MRRQDSSLDELPTGIGKPAQRALAAAGISSLRQLEKANEADLLQLHGMGPKALGIIREALAAQGISFMSEK